MKICTMISYNVVSLFLITVLFGLQQFVLSYFLILHESWWYLLFLLWDLPLGVYMLSNTNIDYAATKGGIQWVLYTWGLIGKLIAYHWMNVRGDNVFFSGGFYFAPIVGVEISLFFTPLIYVLMSFRASTQLYGSPMVSLSFESMLHVDMVVHVMLDLLDDLVAFRMFSVLPEQVGEQFPWLHKCIGVIIMVAIFFHGYSFPTLGSHHQSIDSKKLSSGDIFITRKYAALVAIFLVNIPLLVFRIFMWIYYPNALLNDDVSATPSFSPFLIKNIIFLPIEAFRLNQCRLAEREVNKAKNLIPKREARREPDPKSEKNQEAIRNLARNRTSSLPLGPEPPNRMNSVSQIKPEKRPHKAFSQIFPYNHESPKTHHKTGKPDYTPRRADERANTAYLPSHSKNAKVDKRPNVNFVHLHQAALWHESEVIQNKPKKNHQKTQNIQQNLLNQQSLQNELKRKYHLQATGKYEPNPETFDIIQHPENQPAKINLTKTALLGQPTSAADTGPPKPIVSMASFSHVHHTSQVERSGTDLHNDENNKNKEKVEATSDEGEKPYFERNTISEMSRAMVQNIEKLGVRRRSEHSEYDKQMDTSSNFSACTPAQQSFDDRLFSLGDNHYKRGKSVPNGRVGSKAWAVLTELDAVRMLPPVGFSYSLYLKKIGSCFRSGFRHGLNVQLDSFLDMSYWNKQRLTASLILFFGCQIALVAIIYNSDPSSYDPRTMYSSWFLLPIGFRTCAALVSVCTVLIGLLFVSKFNFFDVCFSFIYIFVQLASFTCAVICFYSAPTLEGRPTDAEDLRKMMWLFALYPIGMLLYSLFPITSALVGRQTMSVQLTPQGEISSLEGIMDDTDEDHSEEANANKFYISCEGSRLRVYNRGRNTMSFKKPEKKAAVLVNTKNNVNNNYTKHNVVKDKQLKFDESCHVPTASILVYLTIRAHIAPTSLNELLIGPDIIKGVRISDQLMQSQWRDFAIICVSRFWCFTVRNDMIFNCFMGGHICLCLIYIIISQLVRLLALRRYEIKAMFLDLLFKIQASNHFPTSFDRKRSKSDDQEVMNNIEFPAHTAGVYNSAAPKTSARERLDGSNTFNEKVPTHSNPTDTFKRSHRSRTSLQFSEAVSDEPPENGKTPFLESFAAKVLTLPDLALRYTRQGFFTSPGDLIPSVF